MGAEKGVVTFGRPLAEDGSVALDMYDTRPIMRLLKKLDVGPNWLSLEPTITNVNGSLDVSVGQGYFALEDLVMTGDGFESPGGMNIRNKRADGRFFVRFRSVMAGVGFDEGRSKNHLSKPRQWFEGQPTGPESGQSPESAPTKTVPAGSGD